MLVGVVVAISDFDFESDMSALLKFDRVVGAIGQ